MGADDNSAPSSLTRNPDGPSLASPLIDVPAGALADVSAKYSPNSPPPTETLDEASLYSHEQDLLTYPNYYYKKYSPKHWSFGWSARQSTPKDHAAGNSTIRSRPSIEDEDRSEEPQWLHSCRPVSPLRLPEQSSPPRSPQRPDSHEPTHSNYFLFSSSETEIEPTGVGAGLRNLGNTCFLNVILQCFTHTVPLVQGLRSSNHPKPCEQSREGFCVLCFLRDHIENSLSSSGRSIAPMDLVDNLSNISSCFQRYQQEDAHEFLQCLLERLDSCCSDSKTNDKLVEQVFGGRLISRLLCCNCSHSSNTYESLIDLSLEIGDVDNLHSALESFTNVEIIEDAETKFTCENCKEYVSVEKQLILDQAPSVAAFHLKRFKADGYSVVKIDKHVEYSLELDLGPYTYGSHNESVELKYELYAVVVHVGFTPSSGHYFCFVRSSPETWHRLDDSKVDRVEEDFVLSQDAYILFYARQGTPWFSSLMESPKSHLEPYILNKSSESVLDNSENTSCSGAVNRDSFVGNRMRDGSEGIFTGKHVEAKAILTKNAIEEISAKLSCGQRRGVLLNESRCGTLVTDTSVVYNRENSSCLRTSNNYERISRCLGGGNLDTSEAMKSDIFHPVAPCTSPSPTKSSDGYYRIPLGHLRSEEGRTCKRQLSNDSVDSKEREANKKEAHRYLTRSGGSCSRRVILASAMNGIDEVKRKKKRMEACPVKVSRQTQSTRQKSRNNRSEVLQYR